jgi:acetyl esterase/lipase
VLALSTYLPLADTLADEAALPTRKTPIFMAHGLSDPVIPCDFGKASADLLKAAGYPLEWRSYPMDHSLCSKRCRTSSFGWPCDVTLTSRPDQDGRRLSRLLPMKLSTVSSRWLMAV